MMIIQERRGMVQLLTVGITALILPIISQAFHSPSSSVDINCIFVGATSRFYHPKQKQIPSCISTTTTTTTASSLYLSSDNNNNNDNEWTSDFDDFGDDFAIGDAASSGSGFNIEKEKGSDNNNDDDTVADDDEESITMNKMLQEQMMATSSDLSGCQARQFLLGSDLILSDFMGSMGFDEVTDWEYFYENEEDPDDRKVTQPNPFDTSQPKRTRESSGSVVRIFRGEFTGIIGGLISAQGLDKRILIKEFSGDLALKLARSELLSIGKLQSELLRTDKEYNKKSNYIDDNIEIGEWVKIASARSRLQRQDNNNVASLLKLLLAKKNKFTTTTAPYLGIFGEVNLAELEGNMDPNDFYRSLGVPPPKPDAIWIVYEYAGLSTINSYSEEPAVVRRAKMPPKRGFFGNAVEPPALPSWEKRADYVVNGILKSALEAMSLLHDNGIIHRSIGRSSIILSSPRMDKRGPSSPYATSASELLIKLADFGFSANIEDATLDEEFITRARSFDLFFKKGERSILSTNFAIAEDMHALGFVFIGVLLSSLAEPKSLDDAKFKIPPTDEDTLQRLLGDVFNKDIKEFRDYVVAEDCWLNLVYALDKNDSAGWTVLETLFLARERVVKFKDTEFLLTAGGLASNKFFSKIL